MPTNVGSKSSNLLNDWRFRSRHVQEDLSPQDFVNAATVLLAAGPPRILPVGTIAGVPTVPGASSPIPNVMLYPIGIIENLSIVSNRQLQILFEVGSKRLFYVPGRVIPQITIARTVFHGPNILRALYAYYPASLINPNVRSLLNTPSIVKSRVLINQIEDQPGFGDFFANLNSDLFDHPFGLALIFKDEASRPYASVYLEMAYINNHQVTVNASSTLVAEGVTIQFERIVPIDIGAKKIDESIALTDQKALVGTVT